MVELNTPPVQFGHRGVYVLLTPGPYYIYSYIIYLIIYNYYGGDMQEELILTDTHKKAMKKRLQGKFVKGPIPLKWVEQACMVGGQEARLAWVIWYRYGLNKGQDFPLSNTIVKSIGLTRHAKGKALKNLEAAGLIVVTCKRGKAPVIKVKNNPQPLGLSNLSMRKATTNERG